MSNYMKTYLQNGQNLPPTPAPQKTNFLTSTYVFWFLVLFLTGVSGLLVLLWTLRQP